MQHVNQKTNIRLVQTNNKNVYAIVGSGRDSQGTDGYFVSIEELGTEPNAEVVDFLFGFTTITEATANARVLLGDLFPDVSVGNVVVLDELEEEEANEKEDKFGSF